MKTAFITYGFAEYSINLVKGLEEHAEILLAIPEGDTISDQLEILNPERVQVYRFPRKRLRQPIAQLRVAWGIVKAVRAFNPDVIHLQKGQMWFNLLLPFLRQYPLVVTIHDPVLHVGDKESQRELKFLTNLARKWANQLIVHAEILKQQVLDLHSRPDDEVHVIPHVAIGGSLTIPTIPEKPNHILFFGRIWTYKGLHHLIEAEPMITAEISDAKIVIAGRGDDFAQYEAMMVHPDNFIIYNNYITPEQLEQLYQETSVVALPYIEATVSGVLVTAYAFSKPVVATRVGGLPEMVEDGKTGYLVPPSDPKALADAIIRLLKDDKLRLEMGAAGKRKVDAEYSPAACGKKTIQVYKKAIASKR